MSPTLRSHRFVLRRVVAIGKSGVGAAIVAWAASASAAELNVLKAIEVDGSADASRVHISGSRSPVYTVFKLENPARVVVDLAGADVGAAQGTQAGAGLVKGVSASQFGQGDSSVVRFVVALEEKANYEVVAGEKGLDVRVSAVADSAPAADANVLHHVRDEHAAAAAVRVESARVSQSGTETRIALKADGEIGSYELTLLQNPPRLALDLENAKSVAKMAVAPSGLVSAFRSGKREQGSRLVFDLTETPRGTPTVVRQGKSLSISLGGAPASETTVASATAPAAKRSVRSVAFSGDEQLGTVAMEVEKDVTYEVTRPDSKTAVLTLHGVSIAKQLERSLDTAAFGGPVRMVSSFASNESSGDVQIVATLESDVTDKVVVTSKGLRWNLQSTDSGEMSIDGQRVELSSSTVRAAGLQGEAPSYALTGGPRKPKYTGRRVSFEFKDIDLHNLLRIIAEVSKKNVIVADDISGKVTIRLRNVPWDQALDIILKTKGLDKDESGNILRIARAEQLATERKAAAEAKQARDDTEEPKLRLIPVNYSDAGTIAGQVKDLLSKKGSVTVDSRTNVLIVKDVVASLQRVEGLVRSLDLQTPQVLIEARIVEAGTSFSREVGIQWGGQVALAPALGNTTGLIFPSTAVATGAASTQGAPGVSTTPNFVVDMPAAAGTGSGSALGFVFGSAGGAATLNLRLSALESQGSAKTISAPRVTTLDNNTATISQGVAIPFSQFSAGGVNTTFIEAKLELTVKPHVTSDGSVMMTINATNNQPNPGFTGANGQPSITKKEARTNVMVKDGDTTVIGGIYTRATSLNEPTTPVLGKIPVLGWLFKRKTETDNRTELLVFVTPHIVNRQQSMASTADNRPTP